MMARPFGFSADPPSQVDSANDAEMFHAALSAEAISLNRVLAYGAARHLLRDLRPDPDQVGGLAVWLMGGPAPAPREPDEDEQAADLSEVDDPAADEDEDDDDEDDEPARRWPAVDANLVRVALLVVASVLLGVGL